MSIVEAAHLAQCLVRDTSTQTFAAVNGWEFAASREYLAIADLYDMYHQAHAEKRVEPYPRPWQTADEGHYGKGTAIPLDELRRVLDVHRAAVEAERVA